MRVVFDILSRISRSLLWLSFLAGCHVLAQAPEAEVAAGLKSAVDIALEKRFGVPPQASQPENLANRTRYSAAVEFDSKAPGSKNRTTFTVDFFTSSMEDAKDYYASLGQFRPSQDTICYGVSKGTTDLNTKTGVITIWEKETWICQNVVGEAAVTMYITDPKDDNAVAKIQDARAEFQDQIIKRGLALGIWNPETGEVYDPDDTVEIPAGGSLTLCYGDMYVTLEGDPDEPVEYEFSNPFSGMPPDLKLMIRGGLTEVGVHKWFGVLGHFGMFTGRAASLRPVGTRFKIEDEEQPPYSGYNWSTAVSVLDGTVEASPKRDPNQKIRVEGGKRGTFCYAEVFGHSCPDDSVTPLSASELSALQAEFDALPVRPLLHVLKMGTGSGRVTSDAGGLDCGLECFKTYSKGAAVVLTAAPAPGSTFIGWSGGCSGTAPCALSMAADMKVYAHFSGGAISGKFPLSVTLAGNGSGKVTSSPAGIDCGGDCTKDLAAGTVVTLTAAPSSSSTFTGWAGACGGTGVCVLTMDAAKGVTATFTATTTPRYTLLVQKTGSGSGAVSSSPGGISCGSDCSEDYTPVTVVTLSATPAPGSSFDGWAGACSGTAACALTMGQALQVTASFSMSACTLSISPGTKQVGAAGGADSISVSAGPGCPWTASSNAGWITINSGAGGTGNDTVGYSVSAGSTCRSAQIIVQGTQQARVCSVVQSGGGEAAQWTGIGPADLLRGVLSIAIHPTNPQTIYIGTTSGEVYKTTDGGADWKALNVGLPSYSSVNAIALQPSNPGIVYLGVANIEENPVRKSLDGGASWSPSAAGLETVGVSALVIDPLNPSRIYAGTNLGFFKSENSGGSWTKSNAGIDPEWVRELAVDPTNGAVIYAGGAGAVFKTTNAGGSWSKILSPVSSTTHTLAIDPVNPKHIFAGSSAGKLHKSTNGGAGWVDLSSAIATSFDIDDLVITPDGKSVYLAQYQGIFRSDDAGATWTKDDSGFAGVRANCLAVDPLDSNRIYAGGLRKGLFRRALTTQSCSFAVSPTSRSHGSGTESGSINVTAPAGATWTAAAGAGWISFTGTPSGTGNGAVDYSVAANSSAQSRTGTITIADQIFTVTQAAAPPPPRYTLTVQKGGTGQGTVTSSSTGINCGGDCSEDYEAGAQVVLIANAAPGSTFTGWSGACAGAGACMVAMTSAHTVTATFATTPPSLRYRLTTQKAGSGDGTVTSAPAGVSCGDCCFADYDSGTQVTLTATPAPGFTFSVWLGDCAGAGSCQLLMSQARQVTAVFTVPSAAVSIAPGQRQFGAAGGSGDIEVVSGQGLAWTAASDSEWLKITSGSSGSSNGTIRYTVSPGPNCRCALITVQSPQFRQVFPVVQTGGGDGACAFSIPVTRRLHGTGAESGSVQVTAPNSASWTVASTSDWISVTSGTPGTGSGAVGYTVSANPAGPARSGTLMIADQALTVTQNGETALYFPYYRAGANELTGFAFSNYSSEPADLRLRAFGLDGQLMPFPGNPASLTLPSQRQRARQGYELFNTAAATPQIGWVDLVSSIHVGGFFQFMTPDVAQLDGATAFYEKFKTLYLTRIFEGPATFRGHDATTTLSLANPNSHSVVVDLLLVWSTGVDTSGLQVSRTIPAFGCLQGSISEVFHPAVPVIDGRVKATVMAGEGIVGFALVQLTGKRTMIGSEALPPGSASVAYSAQLAYVPGVLFTNIQLLNTADSTRSLTLTAIGDDGEALAPPVTQSLAAGAVFAQDAEQTFALTPSAMAVGSLRVTADGPGVIGNVVFGDPQGTFAAALPLQSVAFRRAVFSQVANGLGLFTGIALHNPGPQTALIKIQVFSAEGVKTGETEYTLEKGKRVARQVTELMPSTIGQIGGYVLLESTQPVIAQQLFGSGQLLSAVPPVVIE